MPSAAQIALALVFVKSKPADLTIEAYVEQIRGSINSGQSPDQSLSLRNVDSSKYWRSAYEKALAKFEEVEVRVDHLEKQLTTRKTGRGSHIVAKANTQTKRSGIEICDGGSSDKSAANEDQIGTGSGLKNVLRAHLALSRALARPRAAPKLIEKEAKRLCNAVNTLIHKEKENSVISNHISSDEIRTAIRSLLPTLTTALHQLENNDCHDVLTATLAQIFQSLLGKVHQLALDEIVRLEQLANSKKKKATANARLLQRDSALHKEQHQQACQTLTTTLTSMLSAFNPNSKSTESILEALTCVFLDHLGSLLSLVVFADPSKSTNDGLGVVPPHGLLHVEHVDTNSALMTAELEAPYILQILKKTISVLDKASAAAEKRHASFLGLAMGNQEHSSPFLTQICEKLQSTLLRAVFGDDDETFKDSLRRSVLPEEEDFDSILADQNMADDPSTWFIGQVWEHLGWGIISDGAECGE